MKKKLLALLLVVVMIISIVPVTAFADAGEYKWHPHWPKPNPKPEHVHTPDAAVRENEVAASCKAAGSYDLVVRCTVCTEIISSEPMTLEQLEHTPAAAVRENEVAASCKAAGSYDEVVYCSVCGDEISRESKEIAKAEHTKATHKYGEVAPTCTNDGWHYEYDYCSVCKTPLSQVRFVLDKTSGHTEQTIDAVPATCTQPGLTEGKKCSVCGKVLVPQNPIPLAKHTEETVAGKAPTCTKPGLTEGKKCSVCGKILVPQYVIPAGHKFEIVKVTVKNPTCTEEGLKVAKWQCSVCKHQRGFVFGWDWWYEPIAKDPHTPVVDQAVAPTCTETGLTEGSHCDVCKTVLVEQKTVDALGHNYDGSDHKEPTCTEKGFKEHKCTRCGDVTHYDVPALEHIKKETLEIAPTCEEKGLNVVTCEREGCDLKVKFDVPALGHKEVDVEAVAPTCTKTGLTAGKKCSVCGEFTVAQKEVAALGHTAKVVPAVAATCEATGLTEGKVCSVCGEVLVKQEVVAAIGHAWDEGKITTPATEKADGVKTYTCKNDPTHTKTEAVKYVAPDKDLDEVPKTGDNSGVILATMTGVAMLAAVAYVFGKKRSVR